MKKKRRKIKTASDCVFFVCFVFKYDLQHFYIYFKLHLLSLKNCPYSLATLFFYCKIIHPVSGQKGFAGMK